MVSLSWRPLVRVLSRARVCVCVCQESVRSSSKSSSMKLKIIPKVKKEREKLHKQKSNSSLSGRSRISPGLRGVPRPHLLTAVCPAGTWESKSGPAEADLAN